MLNLYDGPCEGDYLVKRAPPFLRAVVDQKTGAKDVLDQMEDVPKKTEKVYVYKLQGEAGQVHIHGKGINGWYATGNYLFLSNVDGEALRANNAWQEWVITELKKQAY